MGEFEILDGYKFNFSPSHYNDINAKDEAQKEVYSFVRGFMDIHNLKTIVDIGCGSGYKLMKYFDDLNTVGIEVEPCYSYLKEKYPSRVWIESGETERSFSKESFSCDVVICCDVIEHIIDPRTLVDFIKSIDFTYLVISTPDRDVLRTMNGYGEQAFFGPPINSAHVMEWTSSEFYRFIGNHFNILNLNHCTEQKECMFLVCKKPCSSSK